MNLKKNKEKEAVVNCLKCGKDFNSPDKFRIRFCYLCKLSNKNMDYYQDSRVLVPHSNIIKWQKE